MRKLFVVMSVLIVASMLLSACGAPATAAAPQTIIQTQVVVVTPTTAPAPAIASKDTTTLTYADSDVSIDTLDPALAYDTASGEIIQNVYDTLIFYDGSQAAKFVPLLADSWTISPDGKTYTFKLHPGVKFHNGDAMTASDVAYSFQRGLLQSGSASPQWLFAEPFFGVGNQDVAAVVSAKVSKAVDAQADTLVAAVDVTKFDAAAYTKLFTDFAAAYTKTAGYAVDAAKTLGTDPNKKAIDDLVKGLAAAKDEAAKKALIKTAITSMLGAADGGDPTALQDDRTTMPKVDPAILKDVADMVMKAIVADDAAGTVTMTLAQPWGPFLPSIAQTWGSVMDKKWVASNKGWDGSDATWQNFYGVVSADDPFSAIENGTGPFTLTSLKQQEQYTLDAFPGYFKGAPKLQHIIAKAVPEWGTRFAMMTAGDADVATVPAANRSQMDALVGEKCTYDTAAGAYKPCEVTDANKPLRVYLGQPPIAMDVINFNWKIASDPKSPNQYIGSGKLDGNGITPDFFADLNVRKAFAYCFDFDTLINDVYKGEAIQATGLPLPGMPGFFADTPHYSFDLAKCADAFKASTLMGADGKSLWDTGFRVQMLYNQGNQTAQTMAEILAGSLAKVNPKFKVEILGLPWASYLAAQRAHLIPIMRAGWQEDIHDPHNWYQPYTSSGGAYSGRAGLPKDLTAQFDAILSKGVTETDPAKRAVIYKDANQLYYDQAVGVPLVLPTSHGFRQRWVMGEVLNPLFPGFHYYEMYKQ